MIFRIWFIKFALLITSTVAVPIYEYQRPAFYDMAEEFLPQKRSYSKFFRIGKSQVGHSPSMDDVFINNLGDLFHKQDYIPDFIDEEQRPGFNTDEFMTNDMEASPSPVDNAFPGPAKRGMFRFGKMPYFMRNGRTFLQTYYDKQDSMPTTKSQFLRIG